ncbi:MAG: hypothetical protein K2P81_11930 [Bacteriovoracaceae bacterium]|nr:hypothetical protein [Bacteriovoracaceae bacterium]
MRLAYLALLILGLSCSHLGERKPSGEASQTPDYAQIFSSARDILIAKPDQVQLKKVPESVVVQYLQTHPENVSFVREQLIKDIQESQELSDATKPTRLLPPKGMPGYSDLKIFVTHPYYYNKNFIKKSNLIEVWMNFIGQAKKEIILNVFDFDLEEVAFVLIEKARAGLDVTVGIDRKNVMDLRPEVKKIEQMLLMGGVKVTGVMPTGLNHQKITAIDWSVPEDAAVLFSSGNLTRSCLEPEGDLKGTRPLPKESIPNANHLLTMKSWPLANLVHHELTKTLDPKYLLRGKQYPLNGSYQVTGPDIDPETLEAYPNPSITISFTPGGGLKSVNKNLIADLIKRETGPIRMLQFAYSSSAVDEALLFRAQKDFQETGKFDFLSVGDTPFAMREWSRFLIMSGYKRIIGNDIKNAYQPDPENPWSKGLSSDQLNYVQKRVLIAPKVYGNNYAKVEGKSVKVSAKIHHKIVSTQNFAIVGTSFNFSEGAESNNEQILVIRDDQLPRIVEGMVKYLSRTSPGSVVKEAQRRNKFGSTDEAGDSPEDHSAESQEVTVLPK